MGTSPRLALVGAGPELSWAERGSLESPGASHLAGVSPLCESHLTRAQVKNGCDGSLLSGMSALCSVFHIFIQPVEL